MRAAHNGRFVREDGSELVAAAGLRSAQPRPAAEQPMGYTDHGDLIGEIIASRAVEVEFQPILDVTGGQIVGFEALSRGPAGSPLRAPDRLFAAARAVGRAGELDWICRAKAFHLMLEHDLPRSVSLFINVGADSLIVECPEDLLPIIWDASRELRVFVDLAGETMSRHPRKVLETVRRARAAHWGVSIGEIEFSAAGLAMLPTMEPDVVKLDHQMLTHGRAFAGAAISGALGEIEHTGATLLVENVEDQTGYTIGRTLGGRYQRGYLHGRPGPLPETLPIPRAPIKMRKNDTEPLEEPFPLAVDAGAHTASGLTWDQFDDLMLTIASPLAHAEVQPVVLFLLPEGHAFNAELATIYRILLARSPLLLLLGSDTARHGTWRAHGVELPRGHPLLRQAGLVALSHTCALAIIAREQEPGTGLWEAAISENPRLARELLRKTMNLIDTLDGGIRHDQDAGIASRS